MYKIKLSIAHDNEKCNRQLPECGFIWKDFEFIINQDSKEADYWVVYSKGKRETETCRVAPQNTLFITGEPDSIYHYSQGFVNQFGKVLSCQNYFHIILESAVSVRNRQLRMYILGSGNDRYTIGIKSDISNMI